MPPRNTGGKIAQHERASAASLDFGFVFVLASGLFVGCAFIAGVLDLAGHIARAFGYR